jgi:hypothetical protein
MPVNFVCQPTGYESRIFSFSQSVSLGENDEEGEKDEASHSTEFV